MIIAKTNRLTISEFDVNDASFFLELANTPNWIKYIGDRNLKTVEDAEHYLVNKTVKSYTEQGFGFYKVQLKEENNKPIGTCGLTKREALEDVDIGFAFLPEYEGKGLGYEASVKIMELAKHTYKLNKLIAITVAYNKKSIKLLEKLGFVYKNNIKPFEEDEELLLFAKKL